MTLEIKNQKVKSLYERLNKAWHNEKLDAKYRNEVKKRMEIVELLVLTY